jgi:hypothetical protein
MIKPYDDNETGEIAYAAVDALVLWIESGRDLNWWLHDNGQGAETDAEAYEMALGVQKAIHDIRFGK